MQMLKRTLSIVLTVVMLVSMFSMVNVASAAWDGSVATAFASGLGTEAEPYIIMDAPQLALMRDKIAEGKEADAYYTLGADITLNEGVLDAHYNLTSTNFTEWKSSGTFSGVFDGAGHTIYGYFRKDTPSGFFNTITGTVKNLKMKDACTNLTWTEQGILASKIDKATIENVEIDGMIGTKISGPSHPRGFFAGRGSGTFTNCIAIGRSICTNQDGAQVAGGFIGMAGTSTFINCANYVNIGEAGVVGGFVGFTERKLTFIDCVNYGAITSSKAYSQWTGHSSNQHCSEAGGFVGSFWSSESITITRCANVGPIVGDSYAGGFVVYAQISRSTIFI